MAWAAITRAGAVPVPLSTFSKPPELARVIADFIALGRTSIAVTRSRRMRFIARTAYSDWLSSMVTISPPLVPGP